MWFKFNRVESDAFVHYSRFYLGLLPLLRPACEVLVAPDGTKRSICAGGHDTPQVLLPDGGHSISCAVCFSARHAAHEKVNRVFGSFAREAGLIA